MDVSIPVCAAEEVCAGTEMVCDVAVVKVRAGLGHRSILRVDKTFKTETLVDLACLAAAFKLGCGISPKVFYCASYGNGSGSNSSYKEMLITGKSFLVVDVFGIVLAEPEGEAVVYNVYVFSLVKLRVHA